MLLPRRSSWLPFLVEVTSKCPSGFGNNANWGLMLLYSGTFWYANGNLRYLYLNQNDGEWKGKRNVPNRLRNQPYFLRCRRSWYPSNATLYASISCISCARNNMFTLLSTCQLIGIKTVWFRRRNFRIPFGYVDLDGGVDNYMDSNALGISNYTSTTVILMKNMHMHHQQNKMTKEYSHLGQ